MSRGKLSRQARVKEMSNKKGNRENNGNAANNSEKSRLRQNSRITRVDIEIIYSEEISIRGVKVKEQSSHQSARIRVYPLLLLYQLNRQDR